MRPSQTYCCLVYPFSRVIDGVYGCWRVCVQENTTVVQERQMRLHEEIQTKMLQASSALRFKHPRPVMLDLNNSRRPCPKLQRRHSIARPGFLLVQFVEHSLVLIFIQTSLVVAGVDKMVGKFVTRSNNDPSCLQLICASTTNSFVRDSHRMFTDHVT